MSTVIDLGRVVGTPEINTATTTTFSGLLKGADGQIAVAQPGEDYAKPGRIVYITLSAQWSGEGPYTQAVSVDGITVASKVDLQPDAAAISQLVADGVQGLYIANDGGMLTAYAVGAAPTVAIAIQAIVSEVSA